MLTSCFQEPFKHTLLVLKKINNSNATIQHKPLNNIVNDLHSICILNNLLIRLLDFHHYRQLCQIYETLAIDIDPKYVQNFMISNENQQENHFQKSYQDRRQIGYDKLIKKDTTPSTKKSRAIATPNVGILIEDLIESIQKFESIQQNLEHLMSLIQNFNKKDKIFVQTEEIQCYDGDFQRLYYLIDKNQNAISKIKDNKKNVEILQIHKLIKQFVQFMNNVKSSYNEIQELIKTESPCSQETQQILEGLSANENYSKKSNGSKRSLLTEMLRDSSQKSNFQIQNQLPARQLCLRPGGKQYSQKQNVEMIIDKTYRISLVKTQKPRFNSQKLLKSEMEHMIQGINSGKRKAQIQAKKNGVGCSNCQIF